MQTRDKLLDKLLSVQGIFENIFWKFVNQVVYNQRKERIKNILFSVYGYKDTYEIFPPEVDRENMNSILKTMFTYHEQPTTQEDDKKIFIKT